MGMEPITARAWAKLNLTLDVLGKRSDGYHDLCMVMQSVALCDTVTIEETGELGIRVSSNLEFLPSGKNNLATAAALRLSEAAGRDGNGLRITLDKSIPVCAGMGGGSSDAAAVLRALNEGWKLGWSREELAWVGEKVITLDKSIPVCAGMGGGSSDAAAVLRALNEGWKLGWSREELAWVGEKVGSDVPYCVLGGTALAEGRGEILTPLPALPWCIAVLCKPRFSISTPELFSRIDGMKVTCRPDTKGILTALERGDVQGVARRMYNVFEDVLPRNQAGTIAEIKGVLIQHGALGACMSGTGPTVFGLFDSLVAAWRAFHELKAVYPETFLTVTI